MYPATNDRAGAGSMGAYDGTPAAGYWPSGLVQLQVEVDKQHLHSKVVMTKDGGVDERLVVGVPAMYNPLDDHILEGELVAQINHESRRPTVGPLGHPALVSNPSGLKARSTYNHPGRNPSEKQKKLAYRAEALTRVIPFGVSRVNVGPGAVAGFIAQVGGLAQMYQIGEEFTQPGDIVTIDVPHLPEHDRPSNPGAPLMKSNWIATKIEHATPMAALLDDTLHHHGPAGEAMIRLIGAIVEETEMDDDPYAIRTGAAVQQAIGQYHVAMANTYQVLRRLELGVVVRGAMRGEAMLVKLW